eukprot:100160-Chlamydomonas_euryale.AAC.1
MFTVAAGGGGWSSQRCSRVTVVPAVRESLNRFLGDNAVPEGMRTPTVSRLRPSAGGPHPQGLAPMGARSSPPAPATPLRGRRHSSSRA